MKWGGRASVGFTLLTCGGACVWYDVPARLREALLTPETMIEVPVTGLAAMNQVDVAAATAENHWLVAWSDDRMSGNGSNEIWATRVAFDGGVLDPFGISMFDLSSGDDPAVACLPEPCLVVWSRYSAIRGARVSSDGGHDPQAITFSTGTLEKNSVSAGSNGADFLIAWRDDRSGVAAIWAQRVGRDGGSLSADFPVSSGPQDGVDPVVISTRTPVLSGASIIAWSDRRNGNGDIYLAPVTAAGLVGTARQVSTSPLDDVRPAGALDPKSGNVLLAWEVGNDIWGHRFDAQLAPIGGPFPIDTNPSAHRHPAVGWTGDEWAVHFVNVGGSQPVIMGTQVSPAGTVGSPAVVISSAGRQPAFASGTGQTLEVWSSPNFSGGVEARLTNDAGSTTWDIARSAPSQFRPSIAGSSAGFLLAWEDSRLGNLRPMMVPFDRLGARGVPSFLSMAEGDDPYVAAGPNQFLAGWVGREMVQSVRFTRVSPQGVALDVQPIIGPSTFVSHQPSIAYGPGAYLAVWTEERASEDVYGVRIAADGGVLGTYFPIANTSLIEGRHPAVAGTATQWLVAWSEVDRIRFTRVSAAGALLDAPPVTVLGASSARFNPQLATNGTDFLLTWFDAYQAVAARILANGTVLDTTRIVLSNAIGDAVKPFPAWTGQQYVVAWRHDDGRVVTQLIPATGPAALGPPQTLMTAGTIHDNAVIAYADKSKALAVAQSYHRSPPVASARLSARVIEVDPGGGACTIPIECETGLCVAGVCRLSDGGLPVPDAGMEAGVDAGTDAGVDAGIDAGSPGGADGGPGADAGTDGGPGPPRDYPIGCGCTSTPSAAWFAVLLCAAIVRRRAR